MRLSDQPMAGKHILRAKDTHHISSAGLFIQLLEVISKVTRIGVEGDKHVPFKDQQLCHCMGGRTERPHTRAAWATHAAVQSQRAINNRSGMEGMQSVYSGDTPVYMALVGIWKAKMVDLFSSCCASLKYIYIENV